MAKTVAIIQSNYIPWKGYFDIINMVDLLIFHDDLQYTKNDWRNRNKIMTPQGPQWLSIPCGTNEKRLICEVRVDNVIWQKQHWDRIQQSYRKAPFWDYYSPYLEKFYSAKTWSFLSDLNQSFIKYTCQKFLGISTQFEDSQIHNLTAGKGSRVMELLKRVDCTHYVCGPSAKSYLDYGAFENEGIRLEWMDYNSYPEYKQQYAPFHHNVSIIDLIMNTGPEARKFLKSAIN